MILGFKERFKDYILVGTKIHTIREDKPNRWKPGIKIHFATGVRTKNYNCFKEDSCKSIQSIEIKHSDEGMYILIDNEPYALFKGEYTSEKSKKRLNLIALNDGFNCFADFKDFFKNDFSGKIIHWTGRQYLK